MKCTGFVTSPIFLEHDTGQGHPEQADRLRAILRKVGETDLSQRLKFAEAEGTDPKWVERIHSAEHVAHIRAAVEGGRNSLDADTVVSSSSYDAALAAVGGALGAADQVMASSWDNAFCAVRPPGHHAEAERAMGFCLFNNIAILARYLQEHHGLKRIAIFDWDVHHGNGTQHSFEADPSIFYASVHQFPHYPGTGGSKEKGKGEGVGCTLNCPLPGGSGDAEVLAACEEEIGPAIEAFEPDFLLLSAGFDGHEADPLAGWQLTTEGYRKVTRFCLDLATKTCGGKLISLLEGGYDLRALGDSVGVHLDELLVG